MLKLDKIKDGYVSLHTKHGAQVFVKKVGDEFYSANLDNIDPDDHESTVEVDLDSFLFAEQISEQRYHWLREQMQKTAHIKRLTADLQLHQVMAQAQQANLIKLNPQGSEGGNPPAPVEPQPAPPKPAPVGSPQPVPTPPAPAPQNPGADLSSPKNDKGYDGTIVEVPSPGQR